MTDIQVPVLIIGGGGAGLTASMTLSTFGGVVGTFVQSAVAEFMESGLPVPALIDVEVAGRVTGNIDRGVPATAAPTVAAAVTRPGSGTRWGMSSTRPPPHDVAVKSSAAIDGGTGCGKVGSSPPGSLNRTARA